MPQLYVHLENRGPLCPKKGTPRQAIAYITDDHDSKRIATVNQEMLDYLARVDPGYKTIHEGGRVPLMGHRALSNLTDYEELSRAFEKWCEPVFQKMPNGKWKATTGTMGYKSITLTLPKELTLVCETDKERAREAIRKSIEMMIEDVYPGVDVGAVSAMHTRNVAGDPHINVHLLVAKFGRHRVSGRRGSINYDGFHPHGNARDDWRWKLSWTDHVIRELEKSFQIGVSFDKDDRCLITTPRGMPLEPLTRATRRERQRAFELSSAPMVPDGKGGEKPFRINMLDAKILEVSAAAELAERAFARVFPDNKWSVVEKRIATLQAVGYLDERKKPTEAFLAHAEAVFQGRPEHAQVRADIDSMILRLSRELPSRELPPVKPKKGESKPEEFDAPEYSAPPPAKTVEAAPAAQVAKDESPIGEGQKLPAKPPEPPRRPRPKVDLNDTEAVLADIRAKEMEIREEMKRKGGRGARARNVVNDGDTLEKIRKGRYTIEEAVHRRPYDFGSENYDVMSRMMKLSILSGENKTASQSEWLDRRRPMTPEMRAWARYEIDRWMADASRDERTRALTGEQFIRTMQHERRQSRKREFRSQEMHRWAERSASPPNWSQERTIMWALEKDERLIETIEREIQNERGRMALEMASAPPKQQPFVQKKRKKKIEELERTLRKVKAELGLKRCEALRIEKRIPTPQGPKRWKRVESKGPAGYFSPDVTAKIRSRAGGRMQSTARNRKMMYRTVALNHDAMILRRGIRVLRIQGDIDGIGLSVWAGKEDRLLKWCMSGAEEGAGGLTQASRTAARRTFAIGSMLREAELNELFSVYLTPNSLYEPYLNAGFTRMMARCEAMGLRAPDMEQLTLDQLDIAREMNPTIDLLMQEGSEWIRLWSPGEPNIYIGAMFDLGKAMGASEQAWDRVSGKRIEGESPKLARGQEKPSGSTDLKDTRRWLEGDVPITGIETTRGLVGERIEQPRKGTVRAYDKWDDIPQEVSIQFKKDCDDFASGLCFKTLGMRKQEKAQALFDWLLTSEERVAELPTFFKESYNGNPRGLAKRMADMIGIEISQLREVLLKAIQEQCDPKTHSAILSHVTDKETKPEKSQHPLSL